MSTPPLFDDKDNITLVLDREKAQEIRRLVMGSGADLRISAPLGYLLFEMQKAGIEPLDRVECPDMRWDGMVGMSKSHRCGSVLESEERLYEHLIRAHRYPEEDADIAAARAWSER